MAIDPLLVEFVGDDAINGCEEVIEEIVETFAPYDAKIRYGQRRTRKNGDIVLRIMIYPRSKSHARRIISIIDRDHSEPRSPITFNQKRPMTLDDWHEAGHWDGFHGFPQIGIAECPKTDDWLAYTNGFSRGGLARMAYDKSCNKK